VDYRNGQRQAWEPSISTETEDQPSAAVTRPALEAAVEAFVAARAARRLLDNPGRLGANAVVRSRPISGARRASAKAQSAMERAAAGLEQARDRWGALMRGLAADLDLGPEALVPMAESTALRLAILDATQILRAALEAAASIPETGQTPSAAVQRALTALEEAVGSSPDSIAPPGPEL
jgi:hypothetical protein